MKLSVFIFSLFQILLIHAAGIAQGHKIDVTIDGYAGEKAYLGYRRAEKVYSKDTVALTNGKYTFEGPEALAPGIYLILMPPDNKFFEFVVTKAEQNFSVTTKAPDFYQNLKVKGSKDNQLLLDYQKFMSDQVAE